MKRTIFAIVGGGRARDLDEEVGGRGVFRHVALLRRRCLGILGNEEGGVRGRRRVPDGGGSAAASAAAPPVK